MTFRIRREKTALERTKRRRAKRQMTKKKKKKKRSCGKTKPALRKDAFSERKDEKKIMIIKAMRKGAI